MEYIIRNLSDADYLEWCKFVTKVYNKKNHILTDWPFLKWYYGGPQDFKLSDYNTLIAVLPKGEIIGSYGALSAKLRVTDKTYSFCWFVSVIVSPEFRGMGIGESLILKHLENFDVVGGIGYNPRVGKLYKRLGFNTFNDHTLKRFILNLNPNSFDLVKQIGFDPKEAEKHCPIINKLPYLPNENIEEISAFHENVLECINEMKNKVKVTILKTSTYLNWRYFLNPRVKYEVIAKKHLTKWFAFLTARHERFYPTNIYGTRILDLAGIPEHASSLISFILNKAKNRGDGFVEFCFIGSYYDELIKNFNFTELKEEKYNWWPIVTSPIEKRENDDFIFLGSYKFPDLFKNIELSELYFNRSDSDRDRAN